MLRVITLPATLFPGDYRVRQTDALAAGKLLRRRYDDGELISHVRFGSTAHALSSLCGREIEQDEHSFVEPPEGGDEYLHVRLASGTSKRPRHDDIGLMDLDFYHITFTEK